MGVGIREMRGGRDGMKWHAASEDERLEAGYDEELDAGYDEDVERGKKSRAHFLDLYCKEKENGDFLMTPALSQTLPPLL